MSPNATRLPRRSGLRLSTVLVALALPGCDLKCRNPLRDQGGGGVGLPLRLVPVAGNYTVPVLLTAPPGDLTRLFVVEKGGRVRIVKNGQLLATPFLDIQGLVSNGSEQGLLGLAFAPDYATSGRFYVNYTNTVGDTVVARYLVSIDPDVAEPAADRILLTVPQIDAYHNGGHLAFGPDGYLYVALGDGNGNPGGDPAGTAQDPSDLLGSLLRIDVSGPDDYAVPPDNPFVGVAGARPEIWNLGLRNPWRFSFDRLTGDLYIADVGQGALEEIDVATAANGGGSGENYGWNIVEGTECFEPPSNCDETGLVAPAYQYSHSGGLCAVIGGYAYRGTLLPPALQGVYFYGDLCSAAVRALRYSAGVATPILVFASPLPAGGMITSLGEDANGEIYVLYQHGAVYRIAPD